MSPRTLASVTLATGNIYGFHSSLLSSQQFLATHVVVILHLLVTSLANPTDKYTTALAHDTVLVTNAC